MERKPVQFNMSTEKRNWTSFELTANFLYLSHVRLINYCSLHPKQLYNDVQKENKISDQQKSGKS